MPSSRSILLGTGSTFSTSTLALSGVCIEARKLTPRYFVSAPSLTIIGKPSAALSAKIEGDEKERIAKRKAELGEEKLKELEKKVEEAKKESDVPPPPQMISEFPLTDVGLSCQEEGVGDTDTVL